MLNREPVLSLSTDWEPEKWFVRGSYVVRNRPRFEPGLDCEPRKNRLGRGYRDQQDKQNPLTAIALSFYNSYFS